MARFDDMLDMLPSPASDHLRKWKSDVQGLTDLKARQIGLTVIDNLQNEAQFEEVPYGRFIEDLCARYTDGRSVKDAFNEACRDNCLKGPKARISIDLKLHRLVRKDKLIRQIGEKVGWPSGEYDMLYNTMVNPILTDQNIRLDVFSKVPIGLKPPVWCGFHQAQDGEDPIAGLNATRARQVFGLSEEHYPDGVPLLRLTYCPPEVVARYAPTVADAGWRAEWMPAPIGTGYGLTRDLAEKSGKPVPGRGEVVHDNGPLSWLSPPYIPDGVPE